MSKREKIVKHEFQPRWDEQEKGYYCKVCGVLREEHKIFKVEQPKTGELPPFDWKRMEEIAADPLCEEHDFREYCAACLAIEGTRWALKMRGALLAEQHVSAGLREENATLTKKGQELCATLGNLGIHIHKLGLRNDGEMGEWKYRNARAEAAEASLAEALTRIKDLELKLNLKEGTD